MPTAAKLVAAVVFAIVGAIAAHVFIPVLPEGTPFGYFREVAAGVGFLCGWLVMGRTAGRGKSEAISTGIVTSVSILFWCMLGFSIYFMVKRSMNMMYDGPMDAVLGVFQLMYDYGKLLANPAAPIVLLVGGIVGGLITEAASRRWS